MKKMKKGKSTLALLLSGIMLTFSLTGCGNNSGAASSDSASTASVAESSTESSSEQELNTVEVDETDVTKVEGGEVNYVMYNTPDSLSCFVATGAEQTGMLYNVYDGLVKIDSDGSVLPELAESWEISDDGLTYTFHLSKTAYFSDGTQCTADDAVYSYNINAGLAGDEYVSQSRIAAVVESVSKVDDFTMEIKLKEPSASFLSLCCAMVAPVDSYDTLETKPVGSGPYMITSVEAGQLYVYEKNPYYGTCPDAMPSVDKVNVYVCADYSTTANGILSGDYDLAGVSASYIDQFSEDAYNITSYLANGVYLLALNEEYEPLSNVLVRQAINYAIDKEAILQGSLYGAGVVLQSHMSPALANYYNDSIDDYSYDPEKAKELLAEAGYADGFDLHINAASAHTVSVTAGVMIAAYLQDIGINATFEEIEWASWLSDVYAGEQYEATVINIAGYSDPDTIMQIYTQDYARNFYNYSNPAYDELIAKGKATTDIGERAAIYKEAQVILHEEVPCAYLEDSYNYRVARKDLYGVKGFPYMHLDMASLFYGE